MKRPQTLAFLLALSALAFPACSRSAPAGEPVAFRYYSGNESLPPQYQRVTVVRGTVGPSGCGVSYSYRDKDGKVERAVRLEGEKYRRCVSLLRDTRVEVVPPSERRVGGGATDVTLTDARGNSVTGEPSNAAEWSRFVEEVRLAAGVAAPQR